jgi:hypothetical protein
MLTDHVAFLHSLAALLKSKPAQPPGDGAKCGRRGERAAPARRRRHDRQKLLAVATFQ